MAATREQQDERARPALEPQGRRATEVELAWERRWGPAAGVAGLLAAVLFIVSLYIRASALKSSSGDANKVLETTHRHVSAVYVSAATQAIATLLIAGVLVYLYRAARHRRPDTPAVTPILAVAGGLAVAAMTFLAQYELVQAAKEFVTSKPPQPNLNAITNSSAYLHAVEQLDPKKRAEDISNAHFGAGLQAGLLGANLIYGVPFILASLWARRAGLLSRFMGILGIIVGVLYCVPFLGGGGSFIQIPWVGAVGVIALDRWPGKRGESWSSGKPVPWLSAGELRALERSQERRAAAPAAEEPPPDSSPRTSRKRKRKRGRKH